ncbi:MAG: hypothetical protein GEU75_04705 [Dehalococcoidia bacterium]|nr:hypothetical protein [Dehalococcoidia bacterium]
MRQRLLRRPRFLKKPLLLPTQWRFWLKVVATVAALAVAGDLAPDLAAVPEAQVADAGRDGT